MSVGVGLGALVGAMVLAFPLYYIVGFPINIPVAVGAAIFGAEVLEAVLSYGRNASDVAGSPPGWVRSWPHSRADAPDRLEVRPLYLLQTGRILRDVVVNPLTLAVKRPGDVREVHRYLPHFAARGREQAAQARGGGALRAERAEPRDRGLAGF